MQSEYERTNPKKGDDGTRVYPDVTPLIAEPGISRHPEEQIPYQTKSARIRTITFIMNERFKAFPLNDREF